MKNETLIRGNKLPWTETAIKLDNTADSSAYIADQCDTHWEVASDPMYTEHHHQIPGYWTIYRTDNMELLGTVVRQCISQTQNAEAFELLMPLITDNVAHCEYAGQLSPTQTFVVIKFNESYKLPQLPDDDVDLYVVAINDHLKPDGCVLLLNVPVIRRFNICATALLSKNLYKYRMFAPPVAANCRDQAFKIKTNAENCIYYLNNQLEKLINAKLTSEDLRNILDELFPAPPTNLLEANIVSAENKLEEITMLRQTFNEDCFQPTMHEPNDCRDLYIACADYDQHYFKKLENAYSLNYRMRILPGWTTDVGTYITDRALKLMQKHLK